MSNQDQVAEFLARGGKVQQIESGQGTLVNGMPPGEYEFLKQAGEKGGRECQKIRGNNVKARS